MSTEAPHGQGVQIGDHNIQVNNFYARSTPPTPQRLAVGNVPQAPLAFQPRADLMAALRAAGPGVAIVRSVSGMRGVGKTQVAAAYARECINAEWRLVAWVNAEDTAELLSGLAVVADRLEISRPDASLEELGALVRERLQADGENCLLVLDNATALAPLRRYIPAAGKAQVVITSTSLLRLGVSVPVDVFAEDEAIEFLAERTGNSDPGGSADLSRELGYLPLALAQAAAVITAQHLPYQRYLDRLRDLPLADYLIPTDDDPYPRGLAQSVVLSIDALTATGQAGLCLTLLDLIALLSPVGVSRDLLNAAGPAGALPTSADSTAIDAALGQLATASLLTFSADDATVTAHRLVTRVIRERHASDGTLPARAATVCALLHAAWDSLSEPWRDRTAARSLVAHVTALDGYLAPSLRDDESLMANVLDLRGWALWCLNELGDSPSQAIELGEQVLADCARVLGETHADTLTARNNLAFSYQAAGRPDDAITLHEYSLDDHVRVLGDTHPDTLTARNNLANAYWAAGRLDEAITLHEQVLAARATILGDTHPTTLQSRNNVAYVYRAAGRLDEAIPLHERVLAERVANLGEMHPDTLQSQGNLARSYHDAGRLDEAIPLYEQALAGRERILGADHPDTMNIRAALDAARQMREARKPAPDPAAGYTPASTAE
jgi:hypothetical protein